VYFIRSDNSRSSGCGGAIILIDIIAFILVLKLLLLMLIGHIVSIEIGAFPVSAGIIAATNTTATSTLVNSGTVAAAIACTSATSSCYGCTV
jgi:hypothetical protein